MRIQAAIRQYGYSYSTFLSKFQKEVPIVHHYKQQQRQQSDKNKVQHQNESDRDDDDVADRNDDSTTTVADSNSMSPSLLKLNRKVLAELAMNEPFSFKSVVDVVYSEHYQNSINEFKKNNSK
jgi:ribosomal protein L20